ncbi:hypothetical protein LJC68_03080 [Bacteroidales bacterium OttesenSCG-928-B11]|nr:hypothetical protein [Bacteroidales bacterium OttesenSCG-928-C03]MDL2311844.1 hypothetical protein [Bacteroidales bacterium OttesenSCG-928-B11]MDL2325507.1 hypothetical protein [Bacteroidales bacterium OttesenSCG-928-A14]
MRKTELSLAIFAFISLVIKLFHLPGGGALLTVSFSALAMYYMLQDQLEAMKKQAQQKKNQEQVVAETKTTPVKEEFPEQSEGVGLKRLYHSKGFFIFMRYLSNWGFAALLIGIVFQQSHYPGGAMMLTVGLSITIIATLFTFPAYLETKIPQYKPILIRGVIYFIIGLLLYIY